jgi:hypothetical protein
MSLFDLSDSRTVGAARPSTTPGITSQARRPTLAPAHAGTQARSAPCLVKPQSCAASLTPSRRRGDDGSSRPHGSRRAPHRRARLHRLFACPPRGPLSGPSVAIYFLVSLSIESHQLLRVLYISNFRVEARQLAPSLIGSVRRISHGARRAVLLHSEEQRLWQLRLELDCLLYVAVV